MDLLSGAVRTSPEFQGVATNFRTMSVLWLLKPAARLDHNAAG